MWRFGAERRRKSCPKNPEPKKNMCYKFGSCEGGALLVIMSIIGPRERHDYRERNL